MKKIHALKTAVLVAVALLVAAAASAQEVRVVTSGGFTEAYKQLAPQFERATGIHVISAFGASLGATPDAIPNRLKRGEPIDVIILAGPGLEALIKEGRVDPRNQFDLVRSLIGMAVRTGAPKPDISTLDAFKRTLLQAKSIGYSDSASGVYLSTVLFPKLGVAEQVAGKSRKVRGPPSGEPVAAVVARGEAEIGFQQVSELIRVPGVTFVGAIPAELQPGFSFAGALASNARQPDAGSTLLRFLASPAAAPAILKAGLTPPQ